MLSQWCGTMLVLLVLLLANWARDLAARGRRDAPVPGGLQHGLEKMLSDAQEGAKGGREACITRRPGRGSPGAENSKSPSVEYELHFTWPADVPKELPPGTAPVPHDLPVIKRYSI